MPNISDCLEQFEQARRREGRRANGIERYSARLKRFDAWTGSGDLATITPSVLARFVDGELERGVSIATVVNDLTALRAFALWAVSEGLMDSDPTAGLKWPRRVRGLPKPLTSSELAMLWEILNAEPRHDREAFSLKRNRVAIVLMLYAGLRLGEVARLRVADVDLVSRALTIRDSKHGKSRVVAMHQDLVQELRSWLAGRGQRAAVVPGEHGRAIGPKSVAKIFEVWLPARGLKIHAHRLRHTCATQFYAASHNLLALQEFLGHDSPETTRVYTLIDTAQQRAAVDQMPSWSTWGQVDRAAAD